MKTTPHDDIALKVVPAKKKFSSTVYPDFQRTHDDSWKSRDSLIGRERVRERRDTYNNVESQSLGNSSLSSSIVEKVFLDRISQNVSTCVTTSPTSRSPQNEGVGTQHSLYPTSNRANTTSEMVKSIKLLPIKRHASCFVKPRSILRNGQAPDNKLLREKPVDPMVPPVRAISTSPKNGPTTSIPATSPFHLVIQQNLHRYLCCQTNEEMDFVISQVLAKVQRLGCLAAFRKGVMVPISNEKAKRSIFQVFETERLALFQLYSPRISTFIDHADMLPPPPVVLRSLEASDQPRQDQITKSSPSFSSQSSNCSSALDLLCSVATIARGTAA